MPKYCKNSGFTLVELSIVIVIIGVLAGATLAGFELVRSAEVKTTLAEIQKLNESIGQFKSLYKGMPGDITTAVAYWPSTAAGNGDGLISAETSNEPFRALEQLYLAGLLEGSFVGFSGTWGSGFMLSTASSTGNVIGAKGRQGAGIYIKCCSTTDYDRTVIFNNHVSLFSVYSDITKRAGAFTPIEAFDSDKKIDDGVPDTGLVSASGSYTGSAYESTGCYSGVGSASTYDTADATNKESQNCQMQFAFDWY